MMIFNMGFLHCPENGMLIIITLYVIMINLLLN